MSNPDITNQYGAPPSSDTSKIIGGFDPSYKPPTGPDKLPVVGPVGPDLVPTTTLGTAQSKHVYVEGDEWGPLHEPRAQVSQLQDALVKAGLLDPTTFHKGVWDAESAAAFKAVLANANAYGASAPDMLNAMVSNPPERLKAQKAPYPVTNPISIAAAVSGGGPHQSNTARELLGRDLPADQTQAFTKWYQDQESQARTAYAGADAGAGYVDKPGLDAAAAEYIKAHNLPDAQAYGTASRMFSFFDLLKGVV